MTDSLIWSITTEQSTTSTSDLAKQAALNGAPSGSGFIALEQTEGRGRQGRYWLSQRGGMYLSIVLRPKVQKKHWFALSFAASLAVLDTVREQLELHFGDGHVPQSGLKWPNDVIVAGGKIAGILLEAEGEALIVGSGINIAPVKFGSHQEIAPVALADIWPLAAGDLPTPHQLAGSYMARFEHWYGLFNQDGFSPIRDAWLTNALFLGKKLSIKCGAKNFSGVFHNLGMDGALLLLDDLGKTHHIITGDIKILDS